MFVHSNIDLLTSLHPRKAGQDLRLVIFQYIQNHTEQFKMFGVRLYVCCEATYVLAASLFLLQYNFYQIYLLVSGRTKEV